jgi:NADPH2:quinone reductase
MKAAIYRVNGGPEVLTYEDLPDPVAGAGEILVSVKAISIEGGDLIARASVPPDPNPHVGGYSAAGVVAAVGEGVSAFRPGDRVATFGHGGSHAALRVVKSEHAWQVPDTLTLAEAAGAPVAFGTAHECLFGDGGWQAGETVLIQGAAGGVAMAAVQLSAQAGARVIGTVSSESHLEALRALGLNDGVNYRSSDVVAEVRRLTDGKGVQLAIDPIGGSALTGTLACLADRGRAVIVGIAAREANTVDALGILLGRQRLIGTYLAPDMGTARIDAIMRSIMADLGSGKLKMLVDRTFPLSDAASAHRYAETRGRPIGRVIIEP